MIHRKRGETHGQFCKRLELEVTALTNSINVLKSHLVDSNIRNPKSGNLYKDEAQIILNTIVFLEHSYRNQMPTEMRHMFQMTLCNLGFDMAEIYQGIPYNV